MPRQHPQNANLRKTHRVTNKTRLKIDRDEVDPDFFIPDEEEEKNRIAQQTAGVDAEDSREHHLQAVLNAASSRNTGRGRTTTAQVFIPIPDNTGLVSNYEELYPPNKWKDPITKLATSITVEEATNDSIVDGFTYYLDERDKEWLDRNNEEARGEGTSAQGAISSRNAPRSAKGKGKEPDHPQPVLISEDEFELIMGVFEKATHDKTPYLHLGGVPFPPFSDYVDVFSNPLPPSYFESYQVPKWIPSPPNLLKMARAVYPHWRQRREERGGHRIIPVLNYDESDTANESYVCFRRRELKTVRKTRGAQASPSEKLSRLKQDFSHPLQLARLVLQREQHKREQARVAQNLFAQRVQLIDLKRKFSALNEDDSAYLVDREPPAKQRNTGDVQIMRQPLKMRSVQEPGQAAVRRPELPPAPKPRDRFEGIFDSIEKELKRQHERDKLWDDQIDNPYQPPVPTLPQSAWNYIPAAEQGQTARNPRALRMRTSRGGRAMLDRRTEPRKIDLKACRSSLFAPPSDDESEKTDPEDVSMDEEIRALEERWRYDEDDGPVVGPMGLAEQDRVLVDDYDPQYLKTTMSLLGADSDVHSLAPEQCWNYTDPLGRAQARHHLRLILPMMRTQMRPPPRPGMISQTAQQQAAAQAQVNISQVAQQAPPIAIATPQRIQPAQTQHMRISAGRTPSQTSPPTSAHSATPLSVQQGSPIAPQPTHLPNLAPAPSQPGTPRSASAVSHASPPIPSASAPLPSVVSQSAAAPQVGATIPMARSASQGIPASAQSTPAQQHAAQPHAMPVQHHAQHQHQQAHQQHQPQHQAQHHQNQQANGSAQQHSTPLQLNHAMMNGQVDGAHAQLGAANGGQQAQMSVQMNGGQAQANGHGGYTQNNVQFPTMQMMQSNLTGQGLTPQQAQHFKAVFARSHLQQMQQQQQQQQQVNGHQMQQANGHQMQQAQIQQAQMQQANGHQMHQHQQQQAQAVHHPQQQYQIVTHNGQQFVNGAHQAHAGQHQQQLPAPGTHQLPASYMHLAPQGTSFSNAIPLQNGSMSLKLPSNRQTQWVHQRPGSAMNDPSAARPSMSPPNPSLVSQGYVHNVNLNHPPQHGPMLPPSQPSSGMAMRGQQGMVNGLIPSPPKQHATPSPIPSIAQALTPPRPMSNPGMVMLSPAQMGVVGSQQGGY
ncbi:enhancer of polycomb-like-domain-containing protein [Schizophyllum commune]